MFFTIGRREGITSAGALLGLANAGIVVSALKGMGFGQLLEPTHGGTGSTTTPLDLLALVDAQHPGLVAVTAAHLFKGTSVLPSVPQPHATVAPAKSDPLSQAVEDIVHSVQAYHSIALQRVTDYVPMAIDLSLLVNPLKRVQNDLIPSLCQV